MPGGFISQGIIGTLAAPATGGLTVPATTIQVSMTDPFDTPDWIDITRFCKKGSTKRGRQHELRRAIAGTCSLTVTNQDGRFSTFNKTSPYVNMMTAADSYFQDQTIGAAPGTWGGTTNCNLSLVANLGFDSYPAMTLTSVASGDMIASTATGTSGYAVTAGNTYGFMVQFETAVSARTCSAGVAWYNSGGTQVGSNTFGTGVSDSTSAYTKATLTATAPAGATTCALLSKVASTAAANEVHRVTRCMISNADSFGNVSTAWAPGGRGLVPARPVKVLATWSSTQYPVFYGYVDSWLPTYGASLSDQVINASDGLTLLALSYLTTSAYQQQLIADGAVGVWMMNDPVGSQTCADSTTVGGTVDTLKIAAQGANLPVAPTFGQTGLLFSNTTTAALFPGNSLMEGGASLYQISGGLTIEAVLETSSLALATGATLAPTVGTNGGSGEGFTGTSGGFISYQHTSSSTTGAITVNDGKPHHVALTINAAGAWAGYVDGVLDTSGSDSAPGSHLVQVVIDGFAAIAGSAPPTTATITYAGAAITLSALSAAQIAVHASMALHGFTQQQSGQRIAAVLNTLNVPAALQTLATGISAVQSPTAALTTTPALSYIQTVENTEQGFFYIDEAGQYTYRDRHYILQNSAAITSNGTFADDNNGAHYKYLIGSLVPAEDALDLWNDWPVSAVANASIGVTGAIQDAPNADSVRWYGKRTKQGYTSMLMTTDTEAASLSQWGVAHYDQPLARVRQMKLDSTSTNPSSLPQMLGRKLLDRITVIRQPIDGTTAPFSQDSLIENIQHDFGPDLWTTTWGLSVAETQVYFTLNDASKGTLAGGGSSAQNRLGY